MALFSKSRGDAHGKRQKSLRLLALFSVFCVAAFLMACLAFRGFAATTSSVSANPVTLREDTVRAFNDYLALRERLNQESLPHGSQGQQGPFLWIDTLPASERDAAYARLKQGEVVIRRVPPSPGASGQIPNGLSHDWQAVVFIPGAKLDQVLSLLQDYDHHSTYYAPDVEQAHVESRGGDHFRVFMRFRRHKVITVVLNTEQDIDYARDSATRAHSRSSATRIREVADPGTSKEKEKAPGEDNGFLWRMETWWRMEECDGGVYVQNEALTLTRDIPTGLGWLVGPFVNSIPKETLEFTMNATRKGVESRNPQAGK